MTGTFLWGVLLAATVGLALFVWRSAMRRRGFRLLDLLQGEQIVCSAVDVPVRFGGRGRRRGTLVLTRKRLAGFSHRTRFAMLRGNLPSSVLSVEGDWLVVRPIGSDQKPVPAERALHFRVEDPKEWLEEARRVLRLR